MPSLVLYFIRCGARMSPKCVDCRKPLFAEELSLCPARMAIANCASVLYGSSEGFMGQSSLHATLTTVFTGALLTGLKYYSDPGDVMLTEK